MAGALLHVGANPGRELVVAVVAGPLAGAVQGAVAGMATLPLAAGRGRWLLGRGEGGVGWRHLLAATGVGAGQGVVALVALATLPSAVLVRLGGVDPVLSWLAAQLSGTALVALVLWVTTALEPPESNGDRPGVVAGAYLLALAAAGAAASLVLPSLLG